MHGLLSCVRACSEAFYKVFDPDKSCIQIVDKNGAVKVNTCVQCGKCMRTCKHGAITQNPKTGVYMINKKLCTGCGECVAACPMKVMTLGEDRHEVHRLRHLRQGVPDGHSLCRGEVS